MERHPKPNMDRRAGVLDRRLEALLVDGLLVSVIVAGLGYVAGTILIDGSFGGFGGAYAALVFGGFPALIGYHLALEGYYGMTIGKYLRGIVVVQHDGSPVTWQGSALRNVLRVVDSLPVCYIVGIATAYLTDDHQRVGDVAGNTVVVHAES